jgi:CDP-diacylglycerol---glycerol-3-phosphate 3-phosphatidyltransferase
LRSEVSVLLGVLAFGAATMPVYAFSSARRHPDPLDIADRGSFVLGTFARSWFYWFVGPLVRASLALRLTPLFYNLLGVAFGVAAGVLFAARMPALAGWAILLSGVADVMDGRVARALDVCSRRGEFLDATLDRFAELGAFVGLAILMGSSPLGRVVVATALGGSFLVSYARARGECVGVDCNLGVMQRAERLFLMALGGILDPTVSAAVHRPAGTLLLPVLALIALGTVATAMFRTVWIARRLPFKDR